MYFEIAAMNAVKYKFPNTSINAACFSHLSQCFWRHLQEAGLEKYTQDSEFASHIRMLSALAYVPRNKVIL